MFNTIFLIECFLITPLSLLALFTPTHFFIYKYVIIMLDYSLSIFKKIAFIFYNPYFKSNPFDKTNPLFSLTGLVYLNIILIILWIFLDIYREQKLNIARYKLNILKI